MITATPLKRTLFFVFFDMLLSFVSLYLAYNLRFNFHVEPQYMANFPKVFLLLTLLKIGALGYFRIYQVSWRFVSLYEAKKIFWAHVAAYALFVGIYYLIPEPFRPFPRSVLMIDFFLSFIFLGALRIAKRLFVEGGENRDLPKTLLVGVSSYTQVLLKEKERFYVSAIVDDSPMVVRSLVMDHRVESLEDMEKVIAREQIGSVIISKPFDVLELQKIYKRINRAGIYDIKVFSLENQQEKLRPVTVEDLLARHPKDLDTEAIGAFIRGKRILITGAGGSIGSEIVRQCHAYGAEELVLVDNGEYNLYAIGEEFPDAALHLMSVTDREGISELIGRIGPDVVIHAAAYKHVPLCEANPRAAALNNVWGTQNVIDAAIAHAVPRMVIISTDKAVRPTNVMGATKRVTELYAQNVESQKTEIVAVRFGNVLGSSGSVIPKFKAQIESGGPVTVTHPEMTRYFMLIPEACQLVLQAASIAKGGELFILDMGEPVKIVDLAQQMIRLYGKEGEVEIVYTGLRPGEKLYEELLISPDDARTSYPSITVARPTPYPIEELREQISRLGTDSDVRKVLKMIVPEYTVADG